MKKGDAKKKMQRPTPSDEGRSAHSELEYEESAYLTAMSQIKHNENQFAGPPKNVVLVGTKLDLVLKDESLRKV